MDPASPSQLVSRFMPALIDQIRLGLPPVSGQRENLENEGHAICLALDLIKVHTATALSRVHYRRNGFAPVHRLPIELLARIFEFATTGSNHSNGTLFRDVGMVISWVCKVWRGVALHTPTLWTNIDALSAVHTSIFLERSKGAPLDVTIDFGAMLPSSPDDERFVRLASQINRWRSLKVRRYAWPHGDVLGRLISNPAPNLEVVDFLNTFSWRNDVDAPAFSTNPFAGSTPRLRELSTSVFCFPLSHSIYSDLAILHISRACLHEPHFLLPVLARCPQLVELHAHGVIWWPDMSAELPPLSHDIVHLPYLADLQLSMSATAVQYLLTHITTPSSLRVALKSPLDLDETLGHILPPHPDSLRLLREICHLTMSVGENSLDCELRGQTADLKTSLHIVVSGSPGNGSVARVFPYIKQILLMMPLKSFFLDSFSKKQWSATTLRQTLLAFPSIHTLIFHDCHQKFLQLLLSPPQSLCPRLHTLVLSKCSIPGSTLISLVRSRTATRHDEAGRLQRLEIAEPKIIIPTTEVFQMVQLLQEVVFRPPARMMGLQECLMPARVTSNSNGSEPNQPIIL
ncbi:hypothetical protein BOTBODRAFT_31333 [Botryobasidium botryosum FD-172 SS1]|uniref:Uncharacterized protein n=1 Tax=Botryobasidium botryosum (strain FD-172 SS1) TaxID=930990 RepID=A0A067MME8_BOTB1|nr:hypothetical protein BOTBODRAFT_31333 [Botryobasidium botryosum FD-172 SS1]